MTLPTSAVPLAALVATLADARVFGEDGGAISGVAHDSRKVRPGGLFVALRGARVDGHAFIGAAVANGARAVVVDEAFASAAVPGASTTIVVRDTRRALSSLADAYFASPSRSLAVAGVTGTNGKTTATHLIAAMTARAGVATGTIGTLGARFGGAMWSLDNTTPPALEVHELLAEMRARGARAVAMEVSSHALALDRVADVRFSVAALTNVTRDHLDFHADMEAYARAKRSLFEHPKLAVLNGDDPYGRAWARELRSAGRSVVTYGFGEDADVRAADVRVRADGSSFRLDGRAFETRLPGRFNVANATLAIAVARALGGNDDASAAALAAFERVPGRMEHVGADGIDVLVDYAHTPDALEVVLRAARETTHGALVVVFGCGGDRDRGKRPHMGRIAGDLADRVYVTSDNPRSEDPASIIAEIAAGAAPAATLTLEVDRRNAIRRAIATASAGDVVVVAGKGHETYQVARGISAHFDDREEVRAALAARTGANA